jgi:mono/diheme cytochrome c family protein
VFFARRGSSTPTTPKVTAPVATTPVATTPASTTPKTTTPVATTPAATTPAISAVVIDASAVYAAKCAICHGDKRQGGVGTALNPAVLSGKSDSTISDVITSGKTGTAMMAFGSQLSAAEISALATFIKQP